MSKYYSEDPEYTKISLTDKLTRDRIEAVLKTFTREMENYSYYGREPKVLHPGISEDYYDGVAEALMYELNLWEEAE